MSTPYLPGLFRDHFNGQTNPLTPYQEAFGYLQRHRDRFLAWELSKGKDMDGRDMYGVTVLEFNEAGCVTKHHHKLSQGAFRSEAAARDYIETLKQADLGPAVKR